MIKYILLLLLTQNFLFSDAAWSLTRMSLVTGGINPVISSGMNVIISKQESINKQYDKVLQENNTTNQYVVNNSILDKEILSELMQTNFILNQKLDIYSDSSVTNNILLPVTGKTSVHSKDNNYTKTTATTANTEKSATYHFECICAGVLLSAFNRIDTHLFADNLNPLNNKLEHLQPIIKDSISQIKKNKTNLQNEIDRLKLLVLKTKEYIFELNKETPLRVEYKK